MFTLATLVIAEPWDGSNVPGNFQNDGNALFTAFPKNSDVNPTPWSDTYWPSYQGGIANRWNGDESGFDYKLYTKEELQNGAVDIGTLSPAEKYDIYNSRYDYPLLQSEWQRVHPSDASWEGLCHGWAPAAFLFTQPGQATLTNPDGIKVPFYSSDVKALLIYLMAQYGDSPSETDFIGTRCNTDLSANPSRENTTECRDINAGAMFLILANQLGLKKQAFVADIDRGYQVWNQPVSGYAFAPGATRSCQTGAASKCASEQNINLVMSYSQESQASINSHPAITRQANYNVWLELDAAQNVVGGSYGSWARPDFLWTETRKAFTGYFAKLAEVYSAATPNATHAVRAVPTAPHKLATRLPAGEGKFGVAAYRDAPHSLSWCIPAAGARGVRVTFEQLDTRRFRDTVTVYEADSECRIGAPVSVLHGPEGSHKQLSVEVPRGGAIVTFTVDPRAGRNVLAAPGKGFQARYESL